MTRERAIELATKIVDKAEDCIGIDYNYGMSGLPDLEDFIVDLLKRTKSRQLLISTDVLDNNAAKW